MKELSIEEKAKAYDEALEKSKRLYEQGTITESLAYIFPELKESEDERIRKALIKAISRTHKGNKLFGTDVTREEALAWLEQGGQILANSAKTCKDEQKPAWSERDEYRYNACLQYFEEIKPDSVYYKDYLWLKSLKERIEKH